MKLATILLGAVALAVPVGIGCGGDEPGDGAEAGVGSSPSKEQFVRRANSLCGQEAESVLTEADRYMATHSRDGLPGPVFQARMAKEVLLPTIEAKVAILRRLDAPEGDEEQIEAMLSAQEQGIEELGQAKRIDPQKDIDVFFPEGTKLLSEYGLDDCTFTP